MKKLILGDCIEVLKTIPDNSVDFVLTDPPYGVTASKWDKIVTFDFLWSEFDRIGKKDYVAAIFGAQPFTTKLIGSNIKKFKYCWYWNKNQGTNFFHAKRMPIRKVEEICIFGGKKYNPQITDGHIPTNSAKGCSNGNIYHGDNKRDYVGGQTTRYPTNILEYKCVDNYSRIHPNQKPIDLLEFLIHTYTDENDVVLDCFAGSGSTLVSAKKLNRTYIGIEKEEKYFNLINKRLCE
ncbi:MAG: DNA methyltransferase [Bacteroidales bacterium]|jgi:site-specific DNA-methyltransferase (adenine-specific)